MYKNFVPFVILFIITSCTVHNDRDDSSNPLVGQWQFDESSGTVALDSSARKNNGTLVGGPTWKANGQFNGALFFDGKDDHVVLGNDSLALDSELTVSLWVNFEKSRSGYQTLIQRGKYVHPFRVQLAGNRIRCGVRTTQDETSQTHYLSSMTQLAENRWYHVAMSYQNGEYILYINGKAETRDVVSGDLVLGDHATIIGGQQANSSHLHGLLDDVRIYNSALSPLQVQAVFKGHTLGTTGSTLPAENQDMGTTEPIHPAESQAQRITVPTPYGDGWRVMPVRTKDEFRQGKLGGEGEQHPHSITRCLNHPEVIYFSHDVAGVWRSRNSGDTWEKTLDRGLWVNNGQSIEVDPVDPKSLFLVSDNRWNFLGENYQGLYRSSNGGDDWDFVLPVKTNFSGNHHRIYRHNIAYDPSTVSSTGAKRWYVAFPASQPNAKLLDDGGIYRSEDRGVTWTSTPVSKFPGHTTVYAIQTHPSDGKTVFLASNRGLFVSHSRGENFMPLGNFSDQLGISSIAINPQNPHMIYVTLFEGKKASKRGKQKVGKGLYRSLDGGATFSKLKSYNAARVFMNPGNPEVLYLVGFVGNTIVSHDGGRSWDKVKAIATPGLARGYKKAIKGELAGIVANPKNPDEAVAFSQATLWKTKNGGKTFKESSTLFTGYAWAWYNTGVAFDAFDPQRLAFFNFDVGMTITTTGTDYFVWRNHHAWDWYSTFIDDGKGGRARMIPWVGTSSGSFQPIPGSQVIVASIGRYFKTTLMRSKNSGRTWQLVEKPKDGEKYQDMFEMNEFVAFHPKAPDVVYAGNKISYDAGQTFADVDFGGFYKPRILGMCLSQPDTVYAMDGKMRQILRSDDRGETWRLYSKPGWQFRKLDSIPTFAVDPVNPNLVYTIDAKGDLAIFDGKEWHSTGVLALAGGLEVGNFVRGIAIDPNHPEVIYAGMFASGRSGIFRSVDGGDSWEDISHNLPRIGHRAMAVNPHTGELFTGSAVGTWVFPPPYDRSNLIYDKLVSMEFGNEDNE